MSERLPSLRMLLTTTAALLGLVSQGCATVPVTSFERARSLQQGHVEGGLALSAGRLPADGVVVTERDEESDGEPGIGPPTPSFHFRAGVTSRLDAGVQTWPGGFALQGRYGVLDDDQLMMAVIGTVRWWKSGNEGAQEDRFEVTAPVQLGFLLPLATRPLPWLELNVAPQIEFAQLLAQREEYHELQERSYTTLHAGFTFGANFAVWRVRINPAVAVLGVWRSDRDEGTWGIYPGLGAFVVY